MHGTQHSRLVRYGIVLPVIGAAMFLRWLLWPVMGADLPLLFMWPAVLLSAWFGGFGPGLLATFLSALAQCYFVLEPSYSLPVGHPDVQAGLVPSSSLLPGTVATRIATFPSRPALTPTW